MTFKGFEWLGTAPVEYRFYNGEVSVYYDDALHIYVRYEGDREIKIPGSTSILGIVDKSAPLMQWAANKAVEHVKDKLILNTCSVEDTVQRSLVEGWLDEAKFTHKEHKEQAGDIGHIAHNWLEQYIKLLIAGESIKASRYRENLPESPQAASGVTAALDWMRRHNVRWCFTERKIYSRRYDFAGTADGLAYISACGDADCCGHWRKDGDRWERVAADFRYRLAIVDFKTSNSLHDSYDRQVASYLKAIEEEIGDKLDHHIEYRVLLRLDKVDASFESRLLMPETIDRDFQIFLDCLALYRSVNAAEDEEKQRKREVRAQTKTDKEEREEAERQRKADERQRRRDHKEYRESRYKALRASKVSVAEAKETAYREADELYGSLPEKQEEGHPA